ncbi:MAG: DUF6285 domain-containing protein [Cypionkella sp.]
MLDDPPAPLLVAEARQALEAGLLAGFPQKVAANALGIAQRELELGPAFAEAAHRQLVELLGHYGPLDALERELAMGLRESAIGLGGEALLEHLILSACAKLAVDQPGYAGFRALRES